MDDFNDFLDFMIYSEWEEEQKKKEEEEDDDNN